MDELLGPRGAGSERFVTFAFGTFHTVIFIVSAVLVLHLSGALAGLLTGLNTLTGLALFAALWATTTWSTGRAIRGVGGPVLATRTPIGSVVTRAHDLARLTVCFSSRPPPSSLPCPRC